MQISTLVNRWAVMANLMGLEVDDGENFSNVGSDGDSWVSVDRNDDDVDSSSASDCESVVTGSPIYEPTQIQTVVGVNGLVQLDESDKMHEIIKKKFLSCLGAVGVNVQVEQIRKNLFNTSAITQARFQTFQIFTKAIQKKNGCVANTKYAWFGASVDEIDKIIIHGFGHDNIEKNGAFGYGLYLSADHSPLESVKSASIDNKGTRHILLCRVLLGKMEVVNPGSTQCHPSSDEFETGVDSLVSPRKFVVWSTHLNTHILPEFIISFKTLPDLNGPRIKQVPHHKPVSPWIPIPALISALSKNLPPEAMNEIAQYRRNYIEHKISRRDMIQGIREFAGDRLLLMVIKNYREKHLLDQVRKMEAKSNGPVFSTK